MMLTLGKLFEVIRVNELPHSSCNFLCLCFPRSNGHHFLCRTCFSETSCISGVVFPGS